MPRGLSSGRRTLIRNPKTQHKSDKHALDRRKGGVVLVQERVAPSITTHRTVSNPLLTASLVYQDPRKSLAHFGHLFAGVYERDDGMERLLPTEEVKTLFFTHSSLPLVQLLSGRLQLDAFQDTFHIQNLLQPYQGSPRSVHLSGLSLSFHFGRGS
jgi:hypothetical protein